MRGQFGRGDRARHCKTVFEQRPVKRFPVKRNKHRPFRDAHRKFLEQRIFFGEIPHKELLDLQSPGIPPRQPDKKGVGTGSSRQAGCFRIEEQPSRWIFERRSRFSGKKLVAGTREKLQGDTGRLRIFRRGIPISYREMLSKMVPRHACAEELRKQIFLIGRAQSRPVYARGRRPRRFQRGPPGKSVSSHRHLGTQAVKDSPRRFFGARCEIPRRPNAGRASPSAFAGGNQLARLPYQ